MYKVSGLSTIPLWVIFLTTISLDLAVCGLGSFFVLLVSKSKPKLFLCDAALIKLEIQNEN